MSDTLVMLILGLFGSSFAVYLAWLGTKIIDVRERVIRMEENIKSLLDTRTEQRVAKETTTNQRLHDLEQAPLPAPAAPAAVTDTASAMNLAADAADETAEAAVVKAVEVRKRSDAAQDDSSEEDKK